MLRVNSAAELPDDLRGNIGVTAGASAPDELVEGVIAALDPTHGVEEVQITEEDEYFPPPRNLRDLVSAVDLFATFSLGASTAERPKVNDRTVSASTILESLASEQSIGSSGRQPPEPVPVIEHSTPGGRRACFR